MHIVFNRALVERLVTHALAAPRHRRPYRDTPRLPVVPALWLVGDQGVYLMSNGTPPLLRDDVGDDYRHVVCYGDGLAPTDDGWYDRKRAIFGGDDGCNPIPATAARDILTTYPDGAPLVINLTKRQLELLPYRRAAFA